MAHNWQRRDVTLAGWILVLFIAALSLAFGRYFAVLGSLVREHAVPLSFVVLLFAVAVATVARLWVSWSARDDRRISIGFFRLSAIPLALVALALIALTADRGGSLVYTHGLGVGVEQQIEAEE